jgi:hypothetical protein
MNSYQVHLHNAALYASEHGVTTCLFATAWLAPLACLQIWFDVLQNTPNHAFCVCICGAFGPDGTAPNLVSGIVACACCDVRIIGVHAATFE